MTFTFAHTHTLREHFIQTVFIVSLSICLSVQLYSRHCSAAWNTQTGDHAEAGRPVGGSYEGSQRGEQRPVWGIGGWDAQLAANGWQPHVSAEAEHQRPSEVSVMCVVKDCKWHHNMTWCSLLCYNVVCLAAYLLFRSTFPLRDNPGWMFTFYSLLLWRFHYCDLIWLLWHFLLHCRQPLP